MFVKIKYSFLFVLILEEPQTEVEINSKPAEGYVWWKVS